MHRDITAPSRGAKGPDGTFCSSDGSLALLRTSNTPYKGSINMALRTSSTASSLLALALSSMFLTSGCAVFRSDRPETVTDKRPAPQDSGRLADTGRKAAEVVTQPARDLGIAETNIPPLLEQASADPYSRAGLKTCRQLSSAIAELNTVLGPDFEVGSEKKENRAGKLAEAGGKTIINSIIPFRGLVREMTGAAPAQRRLNAAIDAGHARRGFLRGVHRTRKCRTAI